MNIETLNPYVVRILISARDEDSMSSIAKRIGLSYGWTHKWISVLIKEGVFKEKWKELISVKNGDYNVDSLEETIDFMKNNIYNFEPALEMVDEMYHKKLGYKYKEVN